MKKIVFLLFIIMVIVCMVVRNDEVLIPNNAIRIRIIANSDNITDQEQKYEVKKEVSNYLYNKLSSVTNTREAKKIIEENIHVIEEIVNKYSDNFEITYGNNYFPRKEFKGVTYNEGEYESLVIKLGDAKGKNFWCVLFPPLCMIDENNLDKATYKFYVTKLLNNFK